MSTHRWSDNHSTILSADRERWADLRDLWYGRSAVVMERWFARWWPDAWQNGAIVPVYAHILQWGARWLAPCTTEAWRFEGDPRTVAVVSKWERTLKTARAIQRMANFACLHWAVRRGVPCIDMVWGDQIAVEEDSRFPSDLQSAVSIDLSIAAGVVRYYRERGVVVADYVPSDGSLPTREPGAGGMSLYPMWAWYHLDHDHVVPGLDNVWLQHAVVVNEALTDADHTRRNLPGQDVLTSDMKDLRDGDRPMPRGSDKVLTLTSGETYQRFNAPQAMSEALAAIKTYLKIQALLEGLPPDVIDVESYAQTGAAKAIDAAPAWDIRVSDYETTQPQLDQFCLELGPFLEQSGYSADVRIILPEPRMPAIGDPLHREQAAQLRAESGRESYVEQIAAERQIPAQEARAVWLQNLADQRSMGGPNGNQSQDAEREEAGGAADRDADPDDSLVAG
jgi:hypothetical protein